MEAGEREKTIAVLSLNDPAYQDSRSQLNWAKRSTGVNIEEY